TLDLHEWNRRSAHAMEIAIGSSDRRNSGDFLSGRMLVCGRLFLRYRRHSDATRPARLLDADGPIALQLFYGMGAKCLATCVVSPVRWSVSLLRFYQQDYVPVS